MMLKVLILFIFYQHVYSTNFVKKTLQGKINYPEKFPAKLPGKSCLVLKFQDVTRQDMGAVMLARQVVVNPDKLITTGYSFSFPNREMLLQFRDVQVAAVLNVGWCSTDNEESHEWIHQGDYLTDTSFLVSHENINDAKDIIKGPDIYLVQS